MLSCVFAKWHKTLFYTVGHSKKGGEGCAEIQMQSHQYKWRKLNNETYSVIIDINKHWTLSLIMQLNNDLEEACL